jgi:hypothetical protein
MRKPPNTRPCTLRCCGWQVKVFSSEVSSMSSVRGSAGRRRTGEQGTDCFEPNSCQVHRPAAAAARVAQCGTGFTRFSKQQGVQPRRQPAAHLLAPAGLPCTWQPPADLSPSSPPQRLLQPGMGCHSQHSRWGGDTHLRAPLAPCVLQNSSVMQHACTPTCLRMHLTPLTMVQGVASICCPGCPPELVGTLPLTEQIPVLRAQRSSRKSTCQSQLAVL